MKKRLMQKARSTLRGDTQLLLSWHEKKARVVVGLNCT